MSEMFCFSTEMKSGIIFVSTNSGVCICFVHCPKTFVVHACLNCHISVYYIAITTSGSMLQVPSSAFSICKVLQKKVRTRCTVNRVKVGLSKYPLFQVLILHNNELRSLMPKGCDIGTLATLKVIKIFALCLFLVEWLCTLFSWQTVER